MAIFPYYNKVARKRSVVAYHVKVCVMKAHKYASVVKNMFMWIITARLHFVDIVASNEH